MKLLIDSGNTRIKYCLVDQAISHDQTIYYIAPNAITNTNWQQQLSKHEITEIWGVNVNHSHIQQQLSTQLLAISNQSVHWITPSQHLHGLENLYQHPEKLGADRWLALFGVWRLSSSPAPKLVISLGTATTLDTLSPTGQFIGGCILPGWQMMLNALQQGTANLPLASGNFNDFPKTTEQAIVSGVKQSQLGAILQQSLVTANHFQHPVEIHIHGGASHTLDHELKQLANKHSHIDQIYFHENLVLQGLNYVSLAPR